MIYHILVMLVSLASRGYVICHMYVAFAYLDSYICQQYNGCGLV